MKNNNKATTYRKPFAFCMVAAACLITIGIVKGQPDSVMAKAVTICLECIGIG